MCIYPNLFKWHYLSRSQDEIVFLLLQCACYLGLFLFFFLKIHILPTLLFVLANLFPKVLFPTIPVLPLGLGMVTDSKS